MSDGFLFAGEEIVEEIENDIGSWKVIIIDDEPEVHAVTKLALSDFRFQDKSLEFYSAYSGEGGKKLIDEHPDVAIVLLDVVMETDDAGLLVAKYIREVAKNQSVRIILRTGQPGQAPERQVIINHDINDYKSKTELTAQKLFTVMISSLRGYRDILALDNSRKGLQRIIQASTNIFSTHSLENFIQGVLQQLTSVIGSGDEVAMYMTNSLMLRVSPLEQENQMKVLAAQGEFENALGKNVFDVIPQDLQQAFKEAISTKSIVYKGNYIVAYCSSRFSHTSLLYVSGLPKPIGDVDKKMVEIFSQNVQIAYENLQLQIDLEDTQRELVYRLGDAVEQKSNETGNHVKRVALISYLLAQKYGLSDKEAEIIRNAAPLHDVGKVGTPDRILHKPGKLDNGEWVIMKAHTEIGYKILEGSERPIIQAGAIISLEHHENWDGSGYPDGKKGEGIHIFGRIVSMADVYDALRHKRCYKGSWTKKQTLEFIQSQKSIKFDPKLVDIICLCADEIEKIIASNPEIE